MKFEELSIKPEIVKALHELEITEPTDIQEKTIHLIQQGKDVIGISKTGSGKTAAFGIPLLDKFVPGKGIQILIIVPTRELAVQIGKEMTKFGKYLHPKVTSIYGGVAMDPQIRDARHADIVTGTPGRLLDHLQHRTLDLSKLTCVVLDEADKMVDMGFIEDIEAILKHTPKHKQVLLFGATISKEVEGLKRAHMRDPITVKAEVFVEDETLTQHYYDVQPHEKFSLLVHLLKKEKTGRVLVFCSARSTVEMVARNLQRMGIPAEMIHGKLNQNRRLRVLESFHRGRPPLLVASAVAARGLDIKDVSHVINYDLSQDAQEYVHRIGRTARAGESGKAITLLSHKDHDAFRTVLGRYNVNVEKMPAEKFPMLQFQAGERRSYDDEPRGYHRSSGPSRGPSRGHSSGSSREGSRFGSSPSRPAVRRSRQF